jgi:hypothetical protein
MTVKQMGPPGARPAASFLLDNVVLRKIHTFLDRNEAGAFSEVAAMHYALLAVDFIGSFYVTVGFIAGTFEYVKYQHPWYRWSNGKITTREMTICMIAAIPLTPVVAACFGILFHTFNSERMGHGNKFIY